MFQFGMISAVPDGDHGWVALRGANLCLDCEAIYHGAVCPSCAGRNAVPVQRWVAPVDAEPIDSEPLPQAAAPQAATPPAAVPQAAAPRPERWRQAAFGLLGLAVGVWIAGNRTR